MRERGLGSYLYRDIQFILQVTSKGVCITQ